MVSINRLVIVLVLVAAVSALLLAQLDAITAPKIKQSRIDYKLKMVKNVLPAYDNDPNHDRQIIPMEASGTAHVKVEVDDERGKEGVLVYPAYKEGKLVGRAFAVTSHEGYSGDIDLLIGVDPDGAITGVEVINHAETPGLGAKIVSEKTWPGKRELVGRTLADSLEVKKDGGEIDAIAGATISPRAVCKAVKAGLDTYAKRLKAEPPPPDARVQLGAQS
ncbi:MAG: RnfABCDGE type electron transport complex subunit G [Nitrospirota bacterium]|jgi:electron transport complex protein RnfG